MQCCTLQELQNLVINFELIKEVRENTTVETTIKKKRPHHFALKECKQNPSTKKAKFKNSFHFLLCEEFTNEWDLPLEIIDYILSFLSLDELNNLSYSCRTWRRIVGNDYRWKILCEEMCISIIRFGNQTFKSLFGLYKLGRNKCCWCAKRTQYFLPLWNLCVCINCRGFVALLETEVKKYYVLDSMDLEGISYCLHARSKIYLRHDIELIAMSKWRHGAIRKRSLMKNDMELDLLAEEIELAMITSP